MIIDIREAILQLRALFRICFLRPNSSREIAMALITVVFAPLVILICILSNTQFYPYAKKR